MTVPSSGPTSPPRADVVIVGGGAAGLATSVFLGRLCPGLRLVVLERTRRLGAKLVVTGGGRCNVTNRHVSTADFCGGSRRVIDAVLRAFPPERTEAFFAELGVSLHEEQDGKLFPDSNRARTVLDALVHEARRVGASIREAHRVRDLRPIERGFEIGGDRWVLTARQVVIATGGLSLPRSGSDGDGLRLAQALGLAVVPPMPALVPFTLGGSFHRSLAGVSHPAALRLIADGRTAAREVGPLLWTHVGVTGPAVLNLSRHWELALRTAARVRIELSFVPAWSFGDVEARLIRAAADHPTAAVRSAVAAWVSGAVADALLVAIGLDSHTRLAHLTRENRRALAHALVGWDLPVVGTRGYNYAEATAGGISLDEVGRTSLEAVGRRGLYLVGEVLDVDGRLGGYNLQWAWSSAWVASRAIAASYSDNGSR